jgi:hypothetical protein
MCRTHHKSKIIVRIVVVWSDVYRRYMWCIKIESIHVYTHTHTQEHDSLRVPSIYITAQNHTPNKKFMTYITSINVSA